jgi:Domain of unknown function (DUF4383)
MWNSPHRMLGAIVGAVYIVLGIAGFFVTAGIGAFDTEGAALFGVFRTNLLHNLAHLLVGIALLAFALVSVPASRTVNIAVGAAYLLLGMFGLFAVGTSNVLHFASATLLLAVGLGAERPERPTAAS